ncbi:MAG: hypothetical protein WCG20_03025 [bacterium]
MKQKLIDNIISVILVIIFQCTLWCVTHAQGVGIGTANPQAKLHVAGTVRIDTATRVTTTKDLATLDSLGVVHRFSIDSIKKQTAQTFYYQEVNPIATNTSVAYQTRVSLSLPPGTYLLCAYAEIMNSVYDAGVRMWLLEGSVDLAYAIAYSNTSTFGSWSVFRMVSPTVTTTYGLGYSSWPGNTTSSIRRARMYAIKLQ